MYALQAVFTIHFSNKQPAVKPQLHLEAMQLKHDRIQRELAEIQ